MSFLCCLVQKFWQKCTFLGVFFGGFFRCFFGGFFVCPPWSLHKTAMLSHDLWMWFILKYIDIYLCAEYYTCIVPIYLKMYRMYDENFIFPIFFFFHFKYLILALLPSLWISFLNWFGRKLNKATWISKERKINKSSRNWCALNYDFM